jgi:8-oxo-dGTP pyrophosphatase MutT (NUDIX family)
VSLERLAAALAARIPGVAPMGRIPSEGMPPGGFARAAVLVPLHLKDGEPHVMLTKRHADLKHHAGQASFPGGKIERDEEALQAALREAHEEVGLDPAQVTVLGQLSEVIVLRSAFRLTPWVASVPYPYAYAPAPSEVEEIWHVPLAALAAPGVHRTERVVAWGTEFEVHFYDVNAGTIWGATARVLSELLEVWRTL